MTAREWRYRVWSLGDRGWRYEVQCRCDGGEWETIEPSRVGHFNGWSTSRSSACVTAETMIGHAKANARRNDADNQQRDNAQWIAYDPEA